MKRVVVLVHAEGDYRFRAVLLCEKLSRHGGQVNVPGLVQQLLRNIRTGAGIPHVVQRGHPTHGQREEQVIRLVQLALCVEKCKIAPAFHGHGQYIVQNVIGAGEADAQIAVRVHMCHMKRRCQFTVRKLFFPEAQRLIVRFKHTPRQRRIRPQTALLF